MAQHLILVILDDDLGDITSEEDLEEFVSDLKDSTHADLTVRQVYDFKSSFSRVSYHEVSDKLTEMQQEIAASKEE